MVTFHYWMKLVDATQVAQKIRDFFTFILSNNQIFLMSSLFPLTLSALKWIFLYLCTLGHLNCSSFFNIHHRNFPTAPFNSELNSAHFWLKNSGLHEKLAGCLLRERVSLTLFPQKG